MNYSKQTHYTQLLLKAHGYDPGPADGLFGSMTIKALDQATPEEQKAIADKVLNMWVVPHTIEAKDVGSLFSEPPTAICIHYGAGSLRSDLKILTEEGSPYVSAHFSVGRLGRIYQMVELGRVAWHCGDGAVDIPYGGRTLNHTTIGIELENFGWMDFKKDNGVGRNGHVLTSKHDAVEMNHQHAREFRAWWQIYPEDQMEGLVQLLEKIVRYWPSIRYIFGHDDVSPQKFDPGPAFNWFPVVSHFPTLKRIWGAGRDRA